MSKLIVANWKMNGSISQIKNDLLAYSNSVLTNAENVVLAVPSVYLYLASEIKMKSGANYKLAAQDVSIFQHNGAYTGEINASMLKELGVEYIIVGHSERRTLLNERDNLLLSKLENVLSSGLIPIFCIGEEKITRDNGDYHEFLTNQLKVLEKLKNPLKELVIAYEPIWSIGTGVVPTLEQISEVLKLIHAFVQNYLTHAKITLLYGGSVSGKNSKEILGHGDVDGVLVGGASLKVDDFSKICAY